MKDLENISYAFGSEYLHEENNAAFMMGRMYQIERIIKDCTISDELKCRLEFMNDQLEEIMEKIKVRQLAIIRQKPKK
jgi:hypothetical protein